MAIIIKPNDYVENTTIRENVVQAICDAFLRKCTWSIFHPCRDGRFRTPHRYVVGHKTKNGAEFYGFNDRNEWKDEEYLSFTPLEMNAAFKELRNAGYHMYECYEYGTWRGYIVSKKPFFDEIGYSNGREVCSLRESDRW